MKKILLITVTLLLAKPVGAQWKPAGDKIKTKWAEMIDPTNVLEEYPRPIMKRSQWKNLNGLWDYSIQDYGKTMPEKYDGKILVPFAVESSLSGVMKDVGEHKELWYETNFIVPNNWGNKNILLHFGAVDWKADFWLNDIKIGSHTGGYSPFSFDITPFLDGKSQKLVVRVWDPSSDGPQPRGKQIKNPHGIWYTPVTGIWQTVWIEPVNKKSVSDLTITPDLDHNKLNVRAETTGVSYGDILEITVFDGTKRIKNVKGAVGENIEINLDNPKLWSPESPFLYNTTIKLLSGNKTVDEVKSYFAMRKISSKRDENGIVRMQLNNKDYFQFGPLDQGWWPDGLYTAPTDEALKYDIVKTKELGFNMIRKHVKVEPARWYTHCDQLGVLVWQDMPNGDQGPGWQMRSFYKGNEISRTKSSKQIYKKEWEEIIDYLQPYPSIVVWVPFNESWGQFDTVEITEWTKKLDPSRLINSASGGNHFPTGDILDLHNYPDPNLFLYDANRVTVLGEYGGIGLPLEGHLWKTDKNWGYVQFKNSEETTAKYVEYAKKLGGLVKTGFSAAVYTQTTDVEGEINGFMTYDRKIDKMNIAKVRQANEAVIQMLQK
ncbi:beta-galactosidase [Aureibaculum algae]|uniref:Beta-galactosidase n=1 Tax=Aureibaculum algae TaxID=2584122 RepID=A0A5B7TQJ5_9FLAO|nr:sugar-binding domain-containing protein [Aureibaculum algae]QCX37416.1 beta-galactosidase [Aureibaculum algae]